MVVKASYILAVFFTESGLGWSFKWTDEGVAGKNEDLKEISGTTWLVEDNEGCKSYEQN